MIRINLLPVREIKKRQIIKTRLLASAVGFVLFLSLLTSVTVYQHYILSDLNSEKTKLEAEKKKFNTTIEEIKKIEEEKGLIKTRIEIINNLKLSSPLTVHILDEIAALTPLKRIWLTSISQSGGALKISGMALDNQTIAKFMDDLENSNFIDNVSLSNSSMKQYAERNLKAFTLTGSVTMPPSSTETNTAK